MTKCTQRSFEFHPNGRREVIAKFDATDDPLHGRQLGRFFPGYYKCFCYLPLYIFCGSHLLCAKLRPSRWCNFLSVNCQRPLNLI